MSIPRNCLLAAVLGTALMVPPAFAASTEDPKQITPPPTAGGNSAEPDKSGKKAPAKGVKESMPGSNTAQPTAGGNSAEPDKTKGGKGSVGNTQGKDYRSHDPSYPSAGGNSASKDAPARTSEKPEKK